MANKIEENLKASSLLKAPEFMVCGVVLSSRLTVEEYARLEDYETEKDLIGLRVKLEAVQEQNNKNTRDNTSPAYRAQTQKLSALIAARSSKLKQFEENGFNSSDNDDEYLVMLEEKIASLQDKLETLKPDSAKVLQAVTKSQKDLSNFNHEYKTFYLEYVHWLATSRGLTKTKLETWLKDATPQDMANGNEAVRKGKSQRNHTEEPQTYEATPKRLQN